MHLIQKGIPQQEKSGGGGGGGGTPGPKSRRPRSMRVATRDKKAVEAGEAGRESKGL